MHRLKGKVAIITGAAGGQGAAEAQLFVKLGARVVLTDINEAVSETQRSIGKTAISLVHDIADATRWEAVVNEAERAFGRIDVLVNNAAAYNPKSMLETTAAEFEFECRVNALGPMLGMKAVYEPMIRAGGGSIINICSISGILHRPNQFAYAASKWALRGLSGCAAAELGPNGIRVNVVHPGLIETPMLAKNPPGWKDRALERNPFKRAAQPREVAEVVAFLASDAASYVNGAEFTVSAGGHL